MTGNDIVRIAAIGDTHFTKNSQGTLQPLFSQINEEADILLICGDMTDYGLPEEAELFVREMTHTLQIPTIGVLGNHDFESGKQSEVAQIFSEAGIRILDGEVHEIDGIGFAGIKGFGGGFGRYTLGSWGESIIKEFVQEALSEALKLEAALARLRTEHRIVLMHYAPIQTTVEGEPPEIFPFLGSSRMEEPMSRFPITAVFHGHAHRGTFEGRTSRGVPVFNVALPLLRSTFRDRPPFYLMEINRSTQLQPAGQD